jgi:hypothetical protein
VPAGEEMSPARPFDSDDYPTAKKTTKYRSWTKEDVQTLKAMAREKTKTSVVARRLKRTPTATRQKASALGVKLAGASERKRRKA